MAYEIEVSDSAEKDLKKLDRETYIRIKRKLLFFEQQENPMKWSEPLTGFENKYKWRVGKWRITFEHNKKTHDLTILWILEVDNRDTIYKKLR